MLNLYCHIMRKSHECVLHLPYRVHSCVSSTLTATYYVITATVLSLSLPCFHTIDSQTHNFYKKAKRKKKSANYEELA